MGAKFRNLYQIQKKVAVISESCYNHSKSFSWDIVKDSCKDF